MNVRMPLVAVKLGSDEVMTVLDVRADGYVERAVV